MSADKLSAALAKVYGPGLLTRRSLDHHFAWRIGSESEIDRGSTLTVAWARVAHESARRAADALTGGK